MGAVWILLSLSLFEFLSSLAWVRPHFCRDLYLALPHFPPAQAPSGEPGPSLRRIFPGTFVLVVDSEFLRQKSLVFRGASRQSRAEYQVPGGGKSRWLRHGLGSRTALGFESSIRTSWPCDVGLTGEPLVKFSLYGVGAGENRNPYPPEQCRPRRGYCDRGTEFDIEL